MSMHPVIGIAAFDIPTNTNTNANTKVNINITEKLLFISFIFSIPIALIAIPLSFIISSPYLSNKYSLTNIN